MKIEIDIPRPGLCAALLAAGIFGFLWLRDSGMLAKVVLPENQQPAIVKHKDPIDAALAASLMDFDLPEAPPALKNEVPPEGGDALLAKQPMREVEEKIRETRSFQELINRKEEFVRYQLDVLQHEREKLGSVIDPELEEQYRQSVLALTELLQNEHKAEQFILSSLQQLWQAQGRTGEGSTIFTAFRGFRTYPVNPDVGISAEFHADDYPFPFQHTGVDFPVMQGTTVRAPADGTVIEVSDQNGLGFNFLKIEHEEGVVTLYGHITESLVEVGDTVVAGEPIAKSGGMPGTKGAGAFTTGSHLHMELQIDGVPVDPMEYFPEE
jgi:murein DD-endopeptidase MepM/ murein hydrolase activator NlpD